MKKISLIVLLFGILLSVSGCGNNSTLQKAETQATNDSPKVYYYKIEEEPEVEEIKEPKEATQAPSVDNPCGKEDPEEEEESLLPNPENYLEGEIFNLENYLIDCGADKVEITEDGCVATFYDWNIKIHSKSYSEIPELSIENELNGKDYYYDPSGDPGLDTFYQVNNILICKSSIDKLDSIITALYNSGFSFEPPIIYGFIY